MDINSMSLVEIAIQIQSEATEKTTFIDLYNKVCEAKGFTEEERKAHIAQFYTDITASGDFLYCGEELWDLKKNQKLEALDSEFYTEHVGLDEEEEKEISRPRPKKNRKHVSIEEVIEEENREELDSEDESYETTSFDDYDVREEDEDDYDSYEKDVDSKLDEEESQYEDDFDEDRYNSIMDEYEGQYDD